MPVVQLCWMAAIWQAERKFMGSCGVRTLPSRLNPDFRNSTKMNRCILLEDIVPARVFLWLLFRTTVPRAVTGSIMIAEEIRNMLPNK